jgi:hypothetical protein
MQRENLKAIRSDFLENFGHAVEMAKPRASGKCSGLNLQHFLLRFDGRTV